MLVLFGNCILHLSINLSYYFVQGFGSGSGSGLDPDSESGSRRAKMTHKSRKIFFSSCFEVLDGLFCELQASSVTWTYFMEA